MAAARELAGRGDWPGLWELVPSLRPADAVRAVGLFGDAWRPPDGLGQQLFGQLAMSGPGVFESLAEPVRRIRRSGIVRAVSVHAGRQEIATYEWGPLRPGIRVCDLAGGRVVRRWRSKTDDLWPGLLHLGSAVIAVERRGRLNELVRYTWPRSREVLPAPGAFWIARVHDSFLAAGSGGLWRGEAGGPLREVPLPDDAQGSIRGLAAGVASGRVAVMVADSAGQSRIVVLDDELMVIGSSRAGDAAHLGNGGTYLGFCGPDTLITWTGWEELRYRGVSKLRSWVVGETVMLQAQADFSYDATPREWDEEGTWLPVPQPELWVAPVPSLGRVVVGGDPEVTGDFRVWGGVVLDPRTLTPARAGSPPWLRDGERAPAVDGYYIAWWDDFGDLEVYDLRLSALHRLAAEPLAQARPADIELLETAATSVLLSPTAERAVSLLRACLQYRFEL